MISFQDESLVSKEFINVIENTDKSIVDKIPKEIINFFRKKAKNCDKKVILEKGKSLNNQNISEDCKRLLSVMYYSYVANEEEKKEILNKWTDIAVY